MSAFISRYQTKHIREYKTNEETRDERLYKVVNGGNAGLLSHFARWGAHSHVATAEYVAIDHLEKELIRIKKIASSLQNAYEQILVDIGVKKSLLARGIGTLAPPKSAFTVGDQPDDRPTAH